MYPLPHHNYSEWPIYHLEGEFIMNYCQALKSELLLILPTALCESHEVKAEEYRCQIWKETNLYNISAKSSNW